MKSLAGLLLIFGLVARGAPVGPAAPAVFRLPTANRALLQPGGEERYFAGTEGKPWTSGTYGFVRSEGAQFHEGLDIRCVQRDRRGEPQDPVLATADGVVVYVNDRPSLSNYGRYLILRHSLEGLEVFSVYAHLSAVRDGLRPGGPVRGGDPIAVMGRTSNTHQRISQERAHVHFELSVRLSERYVAWHQAHEPGQRNDHGEWNGRNLAGFDPAPVLREAVGGGANFSLLRVLRSQTELGHLLVPGRRLSLAQRNPGLVLKNPRTDQEGIAGWEVAVTPTGMPFVLIPRAASELGGRRTAQWLSVNAAVAGRVGSRHLVRERNGRWELGPDGQKLASLLAF